jgi:hypothetical protein
MKDDSKKRAVEMTGYGKQENQKQVSLVSHSPWKSLSRFPHSHSPGDYREEKWKSKRRIPTFPSRLSIVLKNLKKEDSPERRVPRRSGSSFD